MAAITDSDSAALEAEIPAGSDCRRKKERGESTKLQGREGMQHWTRVINKVKCRAIFFRSKPSDALRTDTKCPSSPQHCQDKLDLRIQK